MRFLPSWQGFRDLSVAVPGMNDEWLTPGCHTVVDGVHRIPLELPQDGLRAVNVYVVESDTDVTLIDGGWHRPGTYREFAASLAQIGCRPDEIDDVYVTHIHRDHYTFAVELRRRHGCRIHLGAVEAPGLHAIAKVNSNVPVSSLREVRRAGAPALADLVRASTAEEAFDIDDWEHPDAWLAPGMLDVPGRSIEAVHTKGHLVFYDHDNAVAFTGDHILPTITPSIGFELGEWDLPLMRFLQSLEAMVSDTDTVIAPAHGAVGDSVGLRARALLLHHAHRFGEILTVLGEHTALDGVTVARSLTWTRRNRSFTELDAFNQLIAVCETMAHLDVLVVRGSIGVRTDQDGVDHFEAPEVSCRILLN